MLDPSYLWTLSCPCDLFIYLITSMLFLINFFLEYVVWEIIMEIITG